MRDLIFRLLSFFFWKVTSVDVREKKRERKEFKRFNKQPLTMLVSVLSLSSSVKANALGLGSREFGVKQGGKGSISNEVYEVSSVSKRS